MVAMGGGVSVSPGAVIQEDYDLFNVKTYGAKGDGTTDDTAAIQAAINAANANGGGVVFFPRGAYRITSAITKTLTADIKLEGAPGASIDATAIEAGTAFALTGARLGSDVRLAGTAARGAAAITTASALSLSTGDVCQLTTEAYCLANPGDTSELWNTANAGYCKGEFIRVYSAVGTTVNLQGGLRATYSTPANVSIYKLSMPKIEVTGLEFAFDGNVYGLYIEYSRGAKVENCVIHGGRSVCLALRYCVDAEVRGNRIYDCWYSGSGTSYGLSIESCQGVVEEGNNIRGGRHAISHGYHEPCRDILVTGNVLDSHHASSMYALDFHDNCEDYQVGNNTILNGISAGGRNFLIDGNAVQIDTVPAGVRITPSLATTEYYAVRNTTITAVGAALTGESYAIHYRPTVANAAVKDLLVENVTLLGTAYGFMLGMPMSESITGSTIDNLILRGCRADAMRTYGVYLLASGAAKIQIDNVEIDRCRLISGDQAIRYPVLDAPMPEWRLTDSYFENTSGNAYVLGITDTGAGDIIARRCRFVGPATDSRRVRFVPAGTSYVEVSECAFRGLGINEGDGALEVSAGTYMLHNNRYVSCLGTLSLAGTPVTPD